MIARDKKGGLGDSDLVAFIFWSWLIGAAQDPTSSHLRTCFGHLSVHLSTTGMARKVFCECCNTMVTLAVAAKHKDNLAQAEYLNSLGRTPMYTGIPIPPITTESVFGSTPPPPPASANDNMDVDNVPLTPVVLSPPPPVTSSDHLPPHHHPISEDDFQPNTDSGGRPCSPEPYNEDLENSALEEEFQALEDPALEEELRAFEGIRYG